MKLIFILLLLISDFAMASRNADIICSSSENKAVFSINTKAGKVWYNKIHEVGGPVFSGIYSPQNYTGEILAEIELNGTGYYLTLIMRSVNKRPELEVFWYPKKNQNQVTRYTLNNCQLK